MLNRWCSILVLVALLFGLLPSPAGAVKSYLFKTCNDSGFCHRNRHFASEVAKIGSDFESRYSINSQDLSIKKDKGLVEGSLLKRLNDGSHVSLPFQISVLSDLNLRLKVNEERTGFNSKALNSKRYDEASKWAFTQEPDLTTFDYSLSDDTLVLTYGEYQAIVNLTQFKIEILYKGTLRITMNDRNLLNMEHYRTKEQQEAENSIHIAPEESTYNAYSDSFKDSKKDKLPFGPESVALDFTFSGYKHVYGIPEHADSLSLKDTTDSEPYRLFNVDIFEYETQSKYPMYGSIPFMIAVSPESSAGIFWINSADTYVDIRKEESNIEEETDQQVLSSKDNLEKVETHWMSENGIIDVVLIVKNNPQSVSQSYGKLTGFTTLPNMFSLGYHQCRWNYNDELDVLDISSKFDEHQIPYDTIWLDIEYTDEKKYFTWKKELFPDHDRMLAKLDETGRNLVAIIDPHLKTHYEVSEQVEKLDVGIKNHNADEIYKGHCWPGESVWIDTLNPESQPFWNKQFENGSEFAGYARNLHIWNDMNEPSVFNGPETTSPKDNIHYGNWEHRSVHNLYGLTYHEATYEAMIQRNPDIRPFILTRSFYSGSQRTSAMWTGDNMAKWEYLKESIPQILTMNVVGFQFAGADVAGFFGNPDKELLTRWYQAGIWYPFFRGHAHIDSRRREPWIAGEPYTSIMRDALRFRYKLLPVLYTQFYQSSLDGSPIMRPLSYETPENTKTYSIDDQFFFDQLLVKPVTSPGQDKVSIYIPDSKPYYNLNTLEKIVGEGYHEIEAPLESIPILIKSGSVIPIKARYRRSSRLMTFDPYTLFVTMDDSAKAKGYLYIDDGESFNHSLDQDFVYIEFEAGDNEIKSSIIDGDATKTFTSKLADVKVERIVLIGGPIVPPKTVDVVQGDKNWTAEVLPADGFWTIRNPGVIINQDWKISLAS
ncbi:glycoside hydrolase family 31 protein [[Candida] arabinofermentans NRRL YB-2248]|uniref:Glucosidase II subunit alpha n=1 Tax=[Candida] arabinofermentans NRRL YB-2248 TaxID=983967 RepID=A0A1E4T7M2_9ASCO|nr:glycoside hydrolase family 31 protein [[Candida] arabinofermentans NRRL YB-2248]